jgi:beta-lactamase regulating signal transducer with metallopeptidase domain
MSLPLAHGFDTTLLHYVVVPAARALALGGVVWMLLAAFRVRDVGFRLAAWTAVLYAALAMPFLGRVMPGIPVLLPSVRSAQPAPVTQPPVVTQAAETNYAAALPARSQPESAYASAPVAGEMPVTKASEATSNISVTPPAASASLPKPVSISWPTVAGCIYGLIAAFLLGRLALGVVLSRKVAREAMQIGDERLARLLAREARRIGLGKAPRLVESAALSIPAAMGVLRPVVLLPRGWEEWSDSQIEAVLAHELSHIARRDPLTQILSGAHRAIFWFSPLGLWLDRALVELAEQASDDAALRAGADRTHYAEVLLHFFRALRTSRGRVRWQAVSMAQGARSTRRLERILSGSSTSIRLGRAAVVAVAIGLVPLVCLAASVEPSFSTGTQMPAPPPPMAPPAPPAAAFETTPPAPVLAPAPAPKAPKSPAAPMALVAPPDAPLLMVVPAPMAAPAAPMLAPAPEVRMVWFYRQTRLVTQDAKAKQTTRRENESWYSNGDCSGNAAFVIFSGNRTMTQCASAADMARVSALRRSIPGNFLWFRRDGRSYVIRDAATVNAAIAAFTPERALARQQAELGKQQEALGRKQSELGMQQEQVRVDVPDFSAAMKQMESSLREINSAAMQESLKRAQQQMEAAFKSLDSSATQEQLGRAQEQLAKAVESLNSSATQRELARSAARMAELQSRLGALQSVAGEKQAALGERQAALGRQQADLGRRQAELGHQQAELARRATERVKQLIDQAIAHGLAKPQ